jgi:hypothetical protein
MDNIPTIGKPHLFGDEPGLFERVLGQGVRNYMEFGLGGSTLAAARAGAESLVAVDSDGGWVRAVQRHPEVAPLIASGRATILHADIGPVGEWGSPADKTHAVQFHRYISAPWREWARREALPDLIYVDGRFRVSCCYSIAAVFAGADVPPPRILMHDMVPERTAYLDVYRFLDVVEQVGSLCLMNLKDHVQGTAVLAALLERQFDFG